MFRRTAFALALLALSAVGAGASGSASPSYPEGGTGPTPFTTIEPAPPGLEPTIDRETALEIAWREEGRRDATSVSASLAVMRTPDVGGAQETPVWIVTYEGVCIVASGPPPGPPPGQECRASTFSVTIDATTGEFLAAGT